MSTPSETPDGCPDCANHECDGGPTRWYHMVFAPWTVAAAAFVALMAICVLGRR